MNEARFDLVRRLAAEALGTAMLVAAVVGSGIMADGLTEDTALALMGNTVATGAILFVLIAVLGPVSGAHFNPAVSVVAALRGDLSWRDAVQYGLVQALGGAVGTFAAHAMFDLPLLQLATQSRSGGAQWLSESIATFGLVLVILVGRQYRAASIPTLVGLYITAAYWFTASTSFANPAVTMARALTGSFSGISPVDAPGFIASQFAGAIAAMLLADWLLQPKGKVRP